MIDIGSRVEVSGRTGVVVSQTAWSAVVSLDDGQRVEVERGSLKALHAPPCDKAMRRRETK